MLARMFKKLTSTLTVVVALFSSIALPQTVFGAETQYFPVASSRVLDRTQQWELVITELKLIT